MKRSSTRGQRLRRGEPGFDEAVLGTSFSGRDPGLRPEILVQANDVDEVVAALREATANSWQVAVCSGGHSWSQNHLREDGLLLDLSRLRSIRIDAGARRAVAGPGTWAIELDGALKKHRLFFPIAHALDVGLGGFLLQGGFGWNSRALGLACEHVVGLDLVLADGSLVHANAEQNADLYWAARGAGSGFFAVVVAYHLRLHPRPGFTGMVLQSYRAEHLEAVFAWAEQVGPDVPRSVELQLLMTQKAMVANGPGIEIVAPVLAESYDTARRDCSFLTSSKLRRKASVALPLFPISTTMMTRLATRRLFPPGMRWSVDNMWTDAPMTELLPGLRRILETMPPAPTHALWMNWYPPSRRPDMAFSVEAKHYLALYGEWKSVEADARHNGWAANRMREMAPMSRGIQLADEGIKLRPARFLSDENMKKLDAVRAARDPYGRFHDYRGRV